MKIVINGVEVEASSGGAGGPVSWEDIQGRPDLSDVSKMSLVKVTLQAGGWSEDKTQTVIAAGVLADEDAQLVIPVARHVDRAAYDAAGVQCVEQGDGYLVFEAASIPDGDIAVNVYVFSAAEVQSEFTGEFVWWSPEMTSATTPSPYAVSASSTINGGYPEYAAFNSLANTCWTSGPENSGANEPWIQFDFGSRKLVRGIRMQPGVNGGFVSPKSYNIEGSDDGLNWKTIATEEDLQSVEKPNYYETLFGNSNFTYRYLRISNLVRQDGMNIQVEVSNIEFLILQEVSNFVWWSPKMTSDNTPAPYAVTGSPPVRSPLYAWQGFTGSSAVSNNACAYLKKDSDGNIWCQIDLGELVRIKGFRVMPEQAKDSAVGFAFGSYNVFSSDDGEHFDRVLSVSGDSFDYNTVGEFYEKMFDGIIRARYVKWIFLGYVIENTSDFWNNVFQNMQLYVPEVYANEHS